MMELNEMFEELKRKFEKKQKEIKSQSLLIGVLRDENKVLNTQMAQQRGQIIELEGKWNKIQKLLKGVKE